MEMKTGQISWFDFPVTDFERAKAFYGEALGWKFTSMGPDYWMIQLGEEMIGGLRKAEGPRVVADSPLIYFAVDKLDSAVERARRLGATLVGQVVEIGEHGCFHCLRDKDENLFAFWAQS